MESSTPINGTSTVDYLSDGPEAQRIARTIPYYPFKGIERFYDIGGEGPKLLDLTRVHKYCFMRQSVYMHIAHYRNDLVSGLCISYSSLVINSS